MKEIGCGSLTAFLVLWAQASTQVQMGSFQDHRWQIAEIPLQFPARGELSRLLWCACNFGFEHTKTPRGMTAESLPLPWQLFITTFLERKATFSTLMKTCCKLVAIFLWMPGATWKFEDFHHCLVWSKQIMVSCVWVMSINSRWAFFWVYQGFIQHFIISHLHLKKFFISS